VAASTCAPSAFATAAVSVRASGEVAEPHALHLDALRSDQPRRLGARDDRHVDSRPRERRGDEAADAAGAEDTNFRHGAQGSHMLAP
jgi:hypothetical protein